MLVKKWKQFLVTADVTNLLANDQVLGDLGPGVYGVIAIGAAAADAVITINDGISNVLDAASPGVRAAAVTYPNMRRLDDSEWVVRYVGQAATIPIDILDGTNTELAVIVKWYGK